MREVSRRAILALALGAVALAAACGGGDSSSEALEPVELREQADAICAEAEEQLDALGVPTDPAEIPRYVAEARALGATQLEKLEELEPPEELAEDYARALELLAERQELIDDLSDEITSGADPVVALQSAPERIEEIDQELDALAREMGLTECGDGGGEDSSVSGGAAAVEQSVASLLAEPFRFTASLTNDVEIIEASPDVEAFRVQQSGTLNFRGEYESSERFVVEPAGGPTLTFYDGQLYATSAGAPEALDESDRGRQALADVPSLLEASVESADLEDLGVEDLDGRQVHHYAGNTDGTAIRDAYARANSFAEVPPPEGALAVEEVQVDFYVDADSGDLLRQSEEARLLLDFAEFGLDAKGAVRLTIGQQRDFADHGEDIVVPGP